MSGTAMSGMRTVMVAVMMVMVGLMAVMSGCVQTAVAPGTRASIAADGTRLENASPSQLQFDAGTAELGERISSSAAGPISYTLAEKGSTRSWRTGQASTEVSFILAPDGQFSVNTSSGKNVAAKAEAIDFNPQTKAVKIKNVTFGTDAAEVQRAQNEAFTALSAYWTSLSQEQRALVVEQLKAQQAIGGIVGDFAGEMIKALVGVP